MTRNQAEIERLKSEYSMQDIVRMYGFEINRGGFICCPFHLKDNTASCKIYPRSYHCFGCGAHGDIFNFMQAIEGISFKEAYEKLGGQEFEITEKESSWITHMRMKRDAREKKLEAARYRYGKACEDMRIYRRWCQMNEPPVGCKSFEDWASADEWIWGFIHLQGAEYMADQILAEIKRIEDS